MTRVPGTETRADRAALSRILSRVRRRWFWLVWSRAFTWMALGAALTWVGVLLVLRTVRADDAGVAAAVAAGAAASLVIVAWAAWSLRRRPSDWQVARYVEERVAGVEERLSTAVEEVRSTPSALAPLVVRDAVRFAASLDLDTVLPRARLRRRVGMLGLAVVAALLPLALVAPSWMRAVHFALVTLDPARVSMTVSPRSGTVEEGRPVRVHAALHGLPGTLTAGPVSLEVDQGGTRRSIDMTPMAGGYVASLGSLDSPVTFQVRARYVTSAPVALDVLRRPRVARLRVRYDYPGYTGLAPRLDEESGDIYAPAGTRVRLDVDTTEPIRSGELAFTDAAPLAGERTGERSLSASFVIERDTSYRIGLDAADGTHVPDTTEYFVRAVDDRPPDVRIMRPGADRRVTPLEEVVVEARADDDYGVTALDLVVSVRGAGERVIPLHRGGRRAAASGVTTLYMEDLDVEPGDFVSYFARARDTGRGPGVAPAQSDIFFLEVRPFNEEFEAAQSQAQGQQGDVGGFDDLVAEQKDIIIATWKLERRALAGRSRDDAATVARAQREVRSKAERLAGGSPAFSSLLPGGSGRTPRPGSTGGARGAPGAGTLATPMATAVEAMTRAEGALSAVRPKEAISHEMTALNALLRAQAEVRRRQVSQQRAASQGGRGRTGNEDLSALFDRELQRQQQTNYEMPNSVEQREDRREDDAMARLRELARRQDDLARAQRELARQQASLQADEARRRLERLTREQEELRRQAERLARQMQAQSGAHGTQDRTGAQGQQGEAGRQGQAGQRGEDTRAMEQAARDMASASEALEQQNASAAEGFGQRASERLREAARRMGAPGREPAAGRAGDLQLSASELADAERRLADRVQREGQGPDAGDRLRQLAGEQDRLSERAADLARAAGQAASSDRGVAAGARTLGDRKVDEAMRRLGQGLREAAGDPQGAAQAASRSLAERGRQLAGDLDRAAEAFGRAAGRDPASRDDARRLARARGLGADLARLEQQIQDASKRLAVAAGGGGNPASAVRENERAQRDLERLQQEFAQSARELNRLDAETRQATALDGDGGGSGQGMATPEAWEPSRAAPGTEAFKQDYARWASLRQDVRLAVERLEATLASRVNAGAASQRLDLGGNDQVPDRYRDAVSRYFQLLSGEGARP